MPTAFDTIIDTVGIDHLSNTLKRNTGNLDMYKNDMTWTFIELVAMQVVDDYEDAVTDLEDVAESNGYNPSRSMTESRYAQV